MPKCFFVSDLHGRTDRYEKLFTRIISDRPDVVLFGGDLLPHGLHRTLHDDFVEEFLFENILKLSGKMGKEFPAMLIILGNDDPRSEEKAFIEHDREGIWKYLHEKKTIIGGYTYYGYAYVPPTPFRLKDWEKYDVSRYVDPGCIPPDEGIHTVETGEDLEYATIRNDIKALTDGDAMEKSIFLFHSPPYNTNLDRAALDGQVIEHVPLDVHVGSIAIMEFIEARQPHITLHGHIHESSRIMGTWRQQLGRTHAFNAAWDGPELALIIFDPNSPENAERLLL
jgi:Icc-related predicted phosphoesterase